MKRINNLYQQIISTENLRLADTRARKGKSGQAGIKLFDQNKEANILTLHDRLAHKDYRTSAYTVFPIYEPKERLIYRLPYYPDRIVHHAVMVPLERIFVSSFTTDTYCCIKGRGILAEKNAIERAFQDVAGTEYGLKIDIRKFYPSIDHDILKSQLKRKFKDQDLLWLLDEIIDSSEGLPIGNYLSQFLANFYLSPFDHWIKEVVGVKRYFRYCDDIAIFSGDINYLQTLKLIIADYMATELNLEVKGNYQVFPVRARGLDKSGYKFYHGYTLMRKSIKNSLKRAVRRGYSKSSISGHLGWAKHCNSVHLLKTLFDAQL